MVKSKVVLYTCPTCGNKKATETGSQPRRCYVCEQVICKKCGIDSICGACAKQFPDLEGKFKFLRILKIIFVGLSMAGVFGGLILVFTGGSPFAVYLILAGGGFIVISVVYMSLEKGLYKKIANKYKEKHNIQNPDKQYRLF